MVAFVSLFLVILAVLLAIPIAVLCLEIHVVDNYRGHLRSGLFGRTSRLDKLLIAAAVLPRALN